MLAPRRIDVGHGPGAVLPARLRLYQDSMEPVSSRRSRISVLRPLARSSNPSSVSCPLLGHLVVDPPILSTLLSQSLQQPLLHLVTGRQRPRRPALHGAPRPAGSASDHVGGRRPFRVLRHGERLAGVASCGSVGRRILLRPDSSNVLLLDDQQAGVGRLIARLARVNPASASEPFMAMPANSCTEGVLCGRARPRRSTTGRSAIGGGGESEYPYPPGI